MEHSAGEGQRQTIAYHDDLHLWGQPNHFLLVRYALVQCNAYCSTYVCVSCAAEHRHQHLHHGRRQKA